MSSPPAPIAVVAPLIAGAAATIGTVVIHAFAGNAIIRFLGHEIRRGAAAQVFVRDLIIYCAAVLVALSAHLVEIALWALVFILNGEFRSFPSALYHSAVNYTTLGYGDVIMSPDWRLLGPLEAADGMILFGLSTAILFAMIQRLAQHRLHTEDW